ncbi:Ni/Fe hydrogenase subunit alpha [Desulfovibrio subterraneus]|uniref:Ni/Fe hydrogenase subunit alpha n=1 Tax=Desulfovibrio subterraneus TaxID=2718620 RepID=UPI0022B8CAE5|nr:Ni/Fe hydrogenase subunit alpha [Desulfovibrio subterraneus]WBF67584.1 Ni/Fe hydrogenase subunit alpha [Desulfovibrio subterraneus]
MSAKKVKKDEAKAPEPVATCAACTDPVLAAEAEGKKTIHVHHVTRVEGHGNIVVVIGENNAVETVRWEVPEAPRFFEAILQGRSYKDVHQIVSRICGICSIGHQLSSLQATEDAMNIRISAQTVTLRKLAIHAENLQSHLLHLAYLVLPDLMGVGSVIPLAETHKPQLVGLIALRRLANEFSRTICGRTTHPQRMVPGGFTKLPTEEELLVLLNGFRDSLPGFREAANLFASLAGKFPDFSRETEYIGLVSPSEYALYRGEVGSSDASRKPASFYRNVTQEYCVPQSTAKWTKNKRNSFMVGALSRYKLNHMHLKPTAQEVAKLVGLTPETVNPYHNNLAQLVECVHSVEDSMELVESLLVGGVKREKAPVIRPRAGRGVGAVEVPRGILFHSYEYDAKGRMVEADCVIPTNMNHANIQHDLEALVPMIADKSEAEIELTTSMLVRAYDPCISCSTHCLDITPNQESKPDRGVKFVYKGR